MRDFQWCESDSGYDRFLPRDKVAIDAHTHSLDGPRYYFCRPIFSFLCQFLFVLQRFDDGQTEADNNIHRKVILTAYTHTH